jgi:hypothetical protein
MPIQTVPGSDLTYHLISYDKHGLERPDDRSGTMSELAAAAIRNQPITDVFVASHGWKGDVDAAIEQYDKWIGAMAACSADRAALRQLRPGFQAFIVGFHWPSQPWGDEELGMGGGKSFAVSATGTAPPESLETAVARFVDDYADRIADTPRARAAIRTIVDGAMKAGPAGNSLPADVADAYKALSEEADVRSDGPTGDPGSDREPFDANRAYRNARDSAKRPGAPPSFGAPGLSGLLSPLRQLSFWTMKDRARTLGETAGSSLLATLMNAVPEGRTVRFHLMGHSFGCIVVSGMIHGPKGAGGLPRPVDSVTLVQGATSLWGFCNAIPKVGGPGYFRKIIEQRRVTGPIVTTQSKRDTAVGVFYPIAAGVALQTSFAPGDLPKYGGLGAFGIQGPGLTTHDLAIADAAHAYGFTGGHIYNLEATGVIKDGGGASGAHSDIAKPEVAHAMWEAVKVT